MANGFNAPWNYSPFGSNSGDNTFQSAWENSLGHDIITGNTSNSSWNEYVKGNENTDTLPAQTSTSSNQDYSDNPYQFGSMEWLKYAGEHGNEAAIDMYYNYMMSEKSATTAREWTAQREDSQYQRMVSDLRNAGINPYFALSGGSPASSATQGVNYQGGQYTSRGSNVRSNDTDLVKAGINAGTDIFSTIMQFLGTIIGRKIGKSNSNKTVNIYK